MFYAKVAKFVLMNKNFTSLPPCLAAGVNEAGCDEAGRGCLAGPVYAAAVILPNGYSNPYLNDSKKITEKRRYELREIIQHDALAWAVGIVSAGEIDRINILNASILAMHRALDALSVSPGSVVVDGNRFRPWRDVKWTTVVKGDAKLANIAAASILAKTYRDDEMKRLHDEYPMYGWNINKGYPTAAHREAIASFGASPIHRMSFKLLPDTQLTLDL